LCFELFGSTAGGAVAIETLERARSLATERQRKDQESPAAGASRTFSLAHAGYFVPLIYNCLMVLRADGVHQHGITGRGVLVAMADTGFYRHPFYAWHGYRYHATLAPDATNVDQDAFGHGTAEAISISKPPTTRAASTA
jgi:hypothetical protein